MVDRTLTELPDVGAWQLLGAYQGHEVVQFRTGRSGVVLEVAAIARSMMGSKDKGGMNNRTVVAKDLEAKAARQEGKEIGRRAKRNRAGPSQTRVTGVV